jgi:hypothetical protein
MSAGRRRASRRSAASPKRKTSRRPTRDGGSDRPNNSPALIRQDVADSVIFIALLGIAGVVIGAYAFAVFSLLHGNWVRAAVAGAIATVPAAGLALAWLKA